MIKFLTSLYGYLLVITLTVFLENNLNSNYEISSSIIEYLNPINLIILNMYLVHSLIGSIMVLLLYQYMKISSIKLRDLFKKFFLSLTCVTTVILALMIIYVIISIGFNKSLTFYNINWANALDLKVILYFFLGSLLFMFPYVIIDYSCYLRKRS